MADEKHFDIPEAALRSLIQAASFNLILRGMESSPGAIVISLASAIGYTLANHIDTDSKDFSFEKSDKMILSVVRQTYEHCMVYKEPKH